MKFFISGSAALNAEIAAWFHAAGILILEGYGMTENAAGATVNHPTEYKIGTVGMPFPGTEVRIASDGEVQLKGPHIMAGYHNRDEATAEAMTDDGWLRTGDKGELDADGFLRDHRPDQGALQDLRRQVHRAALRSRRSSRRSAPTSASSWCSAPSATSWSP